LIDTARNDENAISILVDWLEEYGYLTNQAFHDVRNLWGYKQDEIGDWVHTDYEVSILQLYKAMRERGMRIVPGTPEHVCEQCGMIEDIDMCHEDELQQQALKKTTKFKTISSHSLEFFGLCTACSA
jgi:Fe2+ or Zn2+ uptake regulation protein